MIQLQRVKETVQRSQSVLRFMVKHTLGYALYCFSIMNHIHVNRTPERAAHSARLSCNQRSFNVALTGKKHLSFQRHLLVLVFSSF
jgi:hypothetical protein